MTMTRRKFLKSTIAAAGFVALGGSQLAVARGPGCGGGGGCGSGSSVIDPPVGGPFRDPVEMPAVRSLVNGRTYVDVNLEAKAAAVSINGRTASLFTYNGAYPGPAIRVKKGEILRVHLKNSLPATEATNLLGYKKNRTNLHTHGWHVSPEAPSDYVMYELAPGQAYDHEYDTSLTEAGTLNFYHPHKHGVSAEQYWAGLAGPLVTEDETGVLAGYETHILVIKDITLSGSSPAPHSTMMDYMHGKEGDTIMVNGVVNPRLPIKAGQVQRWRLLNASSARIYRLSLDSHTMSLIGTDGGLLDRPYALSEILLAPGERIDVLVKGTKSSGTYKLKALPYSRMGMMSSPTITLLTMAYSGSTAAQGMPASIRPASRLDPGSLMIMAERTLTLTMGHGNAYINGQDFDVDPYEIHSHLDSYEIWTIQNPGNMDHPFHQHVNASQILSVTGGDPGYASLYTSIPAWKDTVIVPAGGSVRMLVPVMDYKGMAMFHCHILEHEDIGMMGHWHIMDMMM